MGEIPSHKVFENDSAFAFMDIAPMADGMVVIASKSQIANLEDLPEDEYQGMRAAAQKISKALRQTFPEQKKIGVMVEGLEVDHAHIKLFPFTTNEQYRNLHDGSEPDHEQLADFAQQIREAIS